MDALHRVREGDPVAFVRIVASLVPRQREEVINPLAEFTDEELEKLEAYLESIAGQDEPAAPQH
jgi:hypothetical protein